MNSPFTLVIFGATGDLMRSKLLPSLFRLYKEKKLPDKFYILGFARRIMADREFREMLLAELQYDAISNGKEAPNGDWENFSKHLYYQQGIFGENEGYNNLIKKLEEFDKETKACISRFFYLATPPSNYPEILEHLNKTKLAEGCGPASPKPERGEHKSSEFTRIIIEKPFGKDLETAITLDKRLSEIFEEKQIFRVDHYLGKETVQNMIAFRFANGIFEPVWNKDYVDHVQITWGEKKGIGSRGKFFDGVGILRDVAQNHLMQLIAAVAMEQPMHFSKESVRDARANAIKAVQCIDPNDVSKVVVRGQYIGYKKEKDVSTVSNTETFVAIKLFVDTERFKSVPFYLRAGKKTPRDVVEISIVFKQTCHLLFKEYGCPETGNVLTIRIQPDEGIGLRVVAKKPGSKVALDSVNMKFSYKEEFGKDSSEAYEKLLLDIFNGDQMLFNRSDELESSWEFITKILEGWKSPDSKLLDYEVGTWGPDEATELIEKDGRKWL